MEKAIESESIAELLGKLGIALPDDTREPCGSNGGLPESEAALDLAAGARQRLGELLVDAQRLMDEQISTALDGQKSTGEKLGVILVRLGYLSLAERDIVIEFQRRQGAEASGEKLRLGRILFATGEISENQLNEALERKRLTGRRIGEELVAEGYLSSERLERALGLQHRLVMAALVGALSAGAAVSAKQANAAQARAFMNVSATVVDTVSIRSVHQAQNLLITAQDVQRGYVDVPLGSRLEIRNKGPCLFEFRAIGGLFRSARVSLADRTADIAADGAGTLQKSFSGGSESVDVNYRFELAGGVNPGSYKWPMSLTVLPM